MAITISGSGITSANIADGTITTDDILASDVSSLKSGRKNLIINGDMQVAQRGTSATNSGYGSVDRLHWNISAGDFTHSQESDAPDGFSKSAKITIDNTVTDGAYLVWYKLEGQDVQHLKYGTANALPVTLSFWAKASIAGSYTVNLLNRGAVFKMNTASYTIHSADTWEYKTITYVGDTSQAFTDGNTNELEIEWWFGTSSSYQGGTFVNDGSAWASATNADRSSASQVNLHQTANATWQITGVQLELGSVATDFEHRSYGEELALCQRYFERFDYDKSGGGVAAISGQCHETNALYGTLTYQPKRVDPSISTSTISGSNFRVLHTGTATNITGFAWNASRNASRCGATTGGGLTTGNSGIVDTGSSQGQYIDIDAEL